jgi:hypothetical protein
LRPLTRRERIAAGLWVVLGIVLWNAVYDMMLGRGIKEYLFRSMLHEAGRGPLVTVKQIMAPFVYESTWVATFFASLFMLAGFVTIRMLRPRETSNVELRTSNNE